MEFPISFDSFGPLQRQGLEIRHDVDDKGVGLFTTEPLRPGDPIGFYAGLPKGEITRREERFAIDVGGFDVAVVPPLDGSGGGVDFRLYPMAAANEPSSEEVANMVLVSDKIYEVDGLSYVVLAFYATSEIEAGSELTWHYGPLYDRNYAVGRLP